MPGSLLFLCIIMCLGYQSRSEIVKQWFFLICSEFSWNSMKHRMHVFFSKNCICGFFAIRGARDTPRTINDPIGILMFASWGHQGAAKTWKCAHFHDFYDFCCLTEVMHFQSNFRREIFTNKLFNLRPESNCFLWEFEIHYLTPLFCRRIWHTTFLSQRQSLVSNS